MKFFKLIASIFLGIVIAGSAYASNKIRYNGSSTILKGVMYKASTQFKKSQGVSFDLKGKSTGYGIKKLINGECDIAGGGRPLKSDEKAKGLIETKLFLDAHAFIVNKSNTVKELSTNQIKAVLSGKVSTWDQLGGAAGKKVVIVSPPLNSAHYKVAQKIIGFKALPKNAIKSDTTPKVYGKIKKFPVGIGWLSNASLKGKKTVRTLSINNKGKSVSISQSTLENGQYPYKQTMYFYTMGQPKGDIKKFIDYMKGSKGAAIIKQAGFYPIK